MSRVVRASKFRHVFGNPPKKENTYDGLKPSRSAWDSNKVACSTKFVGLIWDAQGGGSFAVLDVNKKGKLGQIPLICGHSGDVLDIEFSPFNDNLVASVSEDCYGKLWTIPDGGLTANVTDPVQSLSGHRRKVGTLNWNPVASNILATTANDNTVKIWDVETGSAALTVEALTDICQSSSWNQNGSLLYTASKDKKLRVIDPRGGKTVQEVEAHPGIKGMRVASLGRQNKIFSFGFSKSSERQFSLWDPSNLTAPLHTENVDTASGILMPFYDDDTNILFLAGKGDGNIRYYELVDEAPYIYYLTEFKSSTPQRGMGQYPKLGMDLGACEIARLFKVAANAVEPISFCVPRKSDIFQDDLYPPTFAGQPSLKAAQWLSGSNADVKRIEIKPGMTIPSAGTTTEFKSAPAGGGDDVTALKARIAELEKQVAEKDRIIADLRG